MFSSKAKDSTPAPVTGVVQPPASKRAVRSGSAPSIISSDVVMVGTITSVGDIQIDGRVDGDVRSTGLVIGEDGQIHGEIFADEVTVRGHVKGLIRARKVLLCSASHVEGDILHEAFAVEAGAFFEGNCRHSDDPLADASKKVAEVKPAMAPAALAQNASPLGRPADEPAPRMPPRQAPVFVPLKTGVDQIK